MRFVLSRIRVPQEYLIGEESPGLKAFRRLMPPFIEIEVIKDGSTPEYDDLIVQSVVIEAGENFTANVLGYMSRLIDDRMGQSTKEFHTSEVADAITPNADGKKLGIPLLKAIVAEMAGDQDPDYIEGVTKVYLIHPPHLQEELRGHLSTLPVPAMFDSPSERLLSVAVGHERRLFVIEPYEMDLTRRRSTDPRWLIVHMYNPDMPAMTVRVEAQGPLTFKEPTPLLADTKVAESWAMKVVQSHLANTGVDVQCVCYEPNGPKTFPDYQARLNGTLWDFEITRVLGDILETRHVLDKPRDEIRMMNRAVQSPPIEEGDVIIALDRAIKSKERKSQSDGAAAKFCLILLNVLDLKAIGQSSMWKSIDLTAFDAVILINGYSQPRIEFVKGAFW